MGKRIGASDNTLAQPLFNFGGVHSSVVIF